ncbi:MAG: hypothetical protein HOP19_20360 [Acidobacteria bacterium]|nr:hypothetical protein [Acidobacteriota bacterium]
MSGINKYAASASTGKLHVKVGAGCPWSASSDQPWLTLTSGATGTREGTMDFSLAANTGPARTGKITVGTQVFTLTQESGCVVTLGSPVASMAVTGGTGNLAVSSSAGCLWSATSDQPWLTLTTATVTGNGSISYSVQPNSGAARSASIIVGNKTFVVNQAGSCAVSLPISGTSFQTSSTGGASGTISVTAATGCVWTAKSDQPWLVVTNGASGTGNGAVSYRVYSNDYAERIGIITVADKKYVIRQDGRCSVNLSSTSGSYSAATATGSVAVTAPGCAWAATSLTPWLNVTDGASGYLNGTVSFSMEANPLGQARIGLLVIGGVDYTVTQAAACSVTAAMTTQTFSGSANTATATVSAPAGCGWTATSDQYWATIESGATSTGNGTVTIKLSYHGGANPRQAKLTIAGRTFTITQQVACNVVSLSSSSLRASAAAGSTTVNVTTDPAGCFFYAYPDSDSAYWTSVSGHGTSRITISFLENNGDERVSKVLIGNQIFTLTQAAKPVNCAGAYFAPITQSAAYPGGTYQVDVSTGMDCRWEAVTATPWIVLEAGTARGIRRGTLSYRVATNPTAQSRTGTLQVNGQSFTVTQAAASTCTFSVTPTSANVAANGGTTTFNVSAGTGCNWSAFSSEMAAKVMTGGTGTGNGTVTVVTQPHTAATARTIKLLIAGQTVTLTQAGGATGNPVPLLMRLASKERTNPHKVSVFGTNFVANSVVRWNGTDRATTFVNSTELEIAITIGEYFADTAVQISVFNPAPGGGLSNTVNFRNPGLAVGVSAAGYNMVEGVAANSIAAIWGHEFTTDTVVGRTVPLPNTLSGVTVLLYDRDGRRYQMPLFFASPYQLNVLVPADLATGLAEIVITCSDGSIRTGYMIVQPVSPGMFSFEASGVGVAAGQVLRLRNGALTYETLARYNETTQRFDAVPIDLGPETDRVFLVLYGTGLRGRSDLSKVTMRADSPFEGVGIPFTPLYVGAQGSFLGLDQMNLEIPRALIGKGRQNLWLNIDGWTGNVVEVNIK